MRPALAAAALLLAASAAAAQEADPGPAIEAVIADQLADFNARDVPGAWEHASPMIQGLFGSPEGFGVMVEEGYPMVWDNRDPSFVERREEAGTVWQRVRVTDPQGRGWLLDYQMVPTDGGWRINGVEVIPAPDLAA